MALLSACAALNSTNIGFDVGVSSGVAVCLQREWGISELQQGVYMGSIHFVAAFGALCQQSLSDRLGRRMTLVAAQIVLVVGLLLSVFAQNFIVLLAGRFFLGIGVGLGLAIDPLYVSELAPARTRGMFTSWPEIACNLGVLIGFCANWVFITASGEAEGSWRGMIATGLILPIILIVLILTVMPESPRWLVKSGRIEEAATILRRTHGVADDVDCVIAGIRDEIERDAESARVGWALLLCPSAVVARMLLVGVGIAVVQQINGSESIVAFSPVIFQRAHVATSEQALFAATALVGLVKTGFVVLAAVSVDHLGRRPLLLFSTSAMTLCVALLSIATALDVGWLAVVAVCSFMASFSMGVGPVTWIMAAEAFPSQYRAKGMSLATFANRLTSGTVCLTFLPLSKALGGQAQYFAFFAVLTGLTVVGTALFAPETKGRTLEQLHGRSAQGMRGGLDFEAGAKVKDMTDVIYV